MKKMMAGFLVFTMLMTGFAAMAMADEAGVPGEAETIAASGQTQEFWQEDCESGALEMTDAAEDKEALSSVSNAALSYDSEETEDCEEADNSAGADGNEDECAAAAAETAENDEAADGEAAQVDPSEASEEEGASLVLEASYYQIAARNFVTRLYNECLQRNPSERELEDMTEKLYWEEYSGLKMVYTFFFSDEMKLKHTCDTCFVKKLYRVFLGREYDKPGLNNWVGKLEGGTTRQEILNGFALSPEFEGICDDILIERGSPLGVPATPEVITGTCGFCGTYSDGTAAFVKRLYRVCLGRGSDPNGYADWTGKLRNKEWSGADVAYGFVFSNEFKNMNLCNGCFVDAMYKAFFGRSADAEGRKHWVELLDKGSTKGQVFMGFVGSKEFANLCSRYDINAAGKNYKAYNYKFSGRCGKCGRSSN